MFRILAARLRRLDFPAQLVEGRIVRADNGAQRVEFPAMGAKLAFGAPYPRGARANVILHLITGGGSEHLGGNMQHDRGLSLCQSQRTRSRLTNSCGE